MRSEIAMIPQILAQQFESLSGPLRTIAEQLNTGGIEHLYLVGCGNSAFAGAAAALAFQKHTGIDAEGIHALDLARYRVRYLPKRSAVTCISFSGRVGRTIEAAIQARKFSHRVLVLTGNPESPLAKEATDIITLSVPTLGYSPGTSTYLAILAALYDLAVEWGEARGSDPTGARVLLRSVPSLAHRTLEEVQEPVQSLAEQAAKHDWITFLGAGPNMATAHFGAAKLFEGPQKLGVATNIEEWAHEEYFVSGAGTLVFLIAPSGASFDRACEILSELNFIGAQPVFISDTRPPISHGTFIPIAVGLMEEFSPLLAALPLSLFAFYLSRAAGQERFEFANPEVAQEHYGTIHRVTQGGTSMSNNAQVDEGKLSSGAGYEVGVLGSARLTEKDAWWAHARKLGMLLAGEGFVVVTGGYGGLMAAVSRGAHEKGGQVVGLPMQHWKGIEPNSWNASLRWSDNYGTRINHILHCDAVIALLGGVGTLSEMTMVWAASQTEERPLPLVLLGECWPPFIESVREHLVVSTVDLSLLRFAATPEEAVQQVRVGLQDKKRVGPGPYG